MAATTSGQASGSGSSHAGKHWIWDLAPLLLLGAVFAPALIGMARVWSSVDFYSHGFLVPGVSLWAGLSMRPRLARLPRARHGGGVLVLVGALGLGLVGASTSSLTLQGVALVAAVAGLCLFLRGPAWLRALSFPIGFLLFMVPLPDAWVTPVIVELQIFVSTVGVGILQLFGWSVYREGNVIEIPGGETLFVAEACSGITSLITLLPLAVFLAYYTERRLGRRLVLVAATLPLAMAGNLLRVIGTVVAAGHYGAKTAAAGPLHEWAGLLTYVIGCLALLAVGAAMRKIAPERDTLATT